MKQSKITVLFNSDLKKVWDVICDNTQYTWRSDLSKIIIMNDQQFNEYTKDGFETKFTITLKNEYKRYEFDIENKNMKGHWIGIFSKKGEQTQVEFIEEVTPINSIMNLFVKTYLKKQQNTYIRDLKIALTK